MTRLSVNINKIATLRNARGGRIPDVLKAATDCQRFGAEGITVHPRPDQRHIRYDDAVQLRTLVYTEYNIEGYPTSDFIKLVKKVKPEQVTLVPDAPDALTSNSGWDTISNSSLLKKIIAELRSEGMRVSLFTGTENKFIEAAAECGANAVELYTEPYANEYLSNREKAIQPFIIAAEFAKNCGLKINAGHDLNLDNLNFLHEQIPFLDEVSIGHALIADSLYFGLENTIRMYLRALQ